LLRLSPSRWFYPK